MSDDPRDVTDDLGLQDARDDEEREVDYDDVTDSITGEPPSWQDRYDTREEWEESR